MLKKAILVSCFCLCACGQNAARLNWEDTSDNEDGFRIYRAVPIAEVGPNVTTFVDKNAVPGSCYAVQSFNSAGGSVSISVTCLEK